MNANSVNQDHVAAQHRGAAFQPSAVLANTAALSLPAVPILKPSDNHTPVQRVINGTGVVQRNMDGLIDALKAKDKKRFKEIFRGMQEAHDELISCKVTYEHALELLGTKGEAEARKFLDQSDKLRLPTAYMAHNVKKLDGTEQSHFVHPTSKNTLPYTAPLSAKGNPRWLNHTSFDQDRAEQVSLGKDTTEMGDKAIEISTRKGAQPPFATNSNFPQSLSDEDAREAHKKREAIKAKHSGYDPSKKQKFDAPWYPSNDGGVSPRRDDPPDVK